MAPSKRPSPTAGAGTSSTSTRLRDGCGKPGEPANDRQVLFKNHDAAQLKRMSTDERIKFRVQATAVEDMQKSLEASKELQSQTSGQANRRLP